MCVTQSDTAQSCTLCIIAYRYGWVHETQYESSGTICVIFKKVVKYCSNNTQKKQLYLSNASVSLTESSIFRFIL